MANPRTEEETEDQNKRELHHANQREEMPRHPTKEGELGEEESAALAAWRRRRA